MGIFGKKKKEKLVSVSDNDGEVKKVKDSKTYPYRVYLKDISGSSTKKAYHFGVERWIDSETGTVWLRNVNYSFQEREPSDSDEYKIYILSEVERKIKDLQEALAKEIKKDDPEVNKKNIEFDLRRYNNIKRSLELQGRGSYQNYDEDGTPYFVFRRKGNFKLPEFDNVDLDTIYTPSEADIKKASELLDMKNTKYSKFTSKASTLTFTFFVLTLLFFGGNIYWSFQLNGMSNDSAIVQLQTRIDETPLFCAEMYGRAGENFYKSSEYVKNITETIVKDLNKPSIVIEGINPN